MSDEQWVPPVVQLAVDLVILTLRQSELHVLLVERGIDPYQGALALPGGFLNNSAEGLLEAARRELSEEAGLNSSQLHLEQIGAYGDPRRDPRGRVVSVVYLAIAPGLPEPAAGTDAAGASWAKVEAVLAGGCELAFDHRKMVESGVERAREKIERTALATAFCDTTFTIAELQRVYEAVWGVRLDPRNFYRKVQNVPGFLTPAGSERRRTKGRPGRLFRAGPRVLLDPPILRPSENHNRGG
ncbi:NUDIX domain-containing protein [Saccharomonospora azurea]|uniref:NUDIX hydrolase n=1 Tax=Saccharomonospora azurea TaxID=40988 RepID=UPI00331ED0BF